MRAVAKKLYVSGLSALPPKARIRVQFLQRHGHIPNIDRPTTFSEYLQHRKLLDGNPQFAQYADKLAVKDIVASKLGADWVIPTYWSGKQFPDQVDWPTPFVVKANHGSGWNYFVREPADLDFDRIKAAVREWLGARWSPHLCEFHYDRIEPTALVEPLIGPPGEDLRDYKIFVFGGRAKYIQVDTDRHSDHKRAFYDPDWVRQEFGLAFPMETRPVEPPVHLAEIVRAAELIGAEFEFARVDFYDLPEGPKFGEITFTPGAGFEVFRPSSMDREFGRLWSEAASQR